MPLSAPQIQLLQLVRREEGSSLLGRIFLLKLLKLLQQCMITDKSLYKGVFNIRGLIGNVVRRFQDKGKRVPAAVGPGFLLDLLEDLPVRVVITDLLILDIP